MSMMEQQATSSVEVSDAKALGRMGRPSVHPRVRAGIEAMIRERRLGPGDPLESEQKLSTYFGVSRPSVRKALKDLSRQGRVISIPGKGHFVSSRSDEPARKTNLILCVLGSYRTDSFWHDSHMGSIVQSLQAALTNDAHRLLIQPIGSPDRQVGSLISPHLRDMAGLVLVPISDQDPEAMLSAAPSDIARVVIGRPVDRRDVPCVFVDHYQAVRRGMDQLIDLGHRRIGFLYLDGGVPSQLRQQAYRDAMTQAGLIPEELLTSALLSDEQAFTQATRQLLTDHPDITALLIPTGASALVYGVAQSLGRNIPRDLSLLGIDDTPLARQLSPALSVIAQPTERLGQIGGQMLLELLAGRNPSPRSVTLDSQLILRDSIQAMHPRPGRTT